MMMMMMIIIIIISRTQPGYYLLFISKITLLKTTAYFGLIFLAHLQVVYIIFSRKSVQYI
jgi:hypothetical protein